MRKRVQAKLVALEQELRSAVTDANGCFTLANVYTEDCIPMHLDCAYCFGVAADGYAPYGESAYGPHPEIIYFYAEVRLAPLAAALCYGNCGNDHAVGIDELLCAVDALLTDAESGWVCADADGDGRLHVAEVLGAASNSLVGYADCVPTPLDADPDTSTWFRVVVAVNPRCRTEPPAYDADIQCLGSRLTRRERT
jgi:hypothetical protein